MAPVSHVTVTAPAGRQTPIGAADGVEPGGGLLYVTAEVVCRVKHTHTIIRSVNRGDLILCNMDGSPVNSAQAAAAPEELPGGKIILADRKAKSGGTK